MFLSQQKIDNENIQNGAEPHNHPMKPPQNHQFFLFLLGSGEFKKAIPDPELPLQRLELLPSSVAWLTLSWM